MPKTFFATVFSLGVVVVFAVIVAATAIAQNKPWEAPPEAALKANPVQLTGASISRGKALFSEYCTPCHGKEGKGDGPVAIRLITEPPDLTAIDPEQTDGELAWKIGTGRNPMPKWNDKLIAGELWDLVNFVRSLQKDAE